MGLQIPTKMLDGLLVPVVECTPAAGDASRVHRRADMAAHWGEAQEVTTKVSTNFVHLSAFLEEFVYCTSFYLRAWSYCVNAWLVQ